MAGLGLCNITTTIFDLGMRKFLGKACYLCFGCRLSKIKFEVHSYSEYGITETEGIIGFIMQTPQNSPRSGQLNFLIKLAELAEFSNQSAEFLKKSAELAEC